ncbi:VOC family protein [Paenibacillus hodogayensis]|uniref:VOC family protein n=1 Tax=Paenibacillus hodogayensis TaxID=279208 RepID=A0ABV5VSY5_9BACL
MAKHTPYLFSEDARAQAEFYIQALGGEILSVMTHGQMPGANEQLKDKVLHLSFVAAGTSFFMADTVTEPVNPGNGISLNLEFPNEAEAREAFDNLSAGGRVKHPFSMAFWGTFFGQFEDKFGVNWMIVTEDPNNRS